MKEKISRIVFTFLIIGVIIFQFSFFSRASNDISNTLICWGLKRAQRKWATNFRL